MFANVPRRPRTTKYASKPSRARGVLVTTKKRKVTYRRKKYPARLSNSRINYAVAKQVSRVMSRVSETKVLPMTKYDEVNPTPIQLGAQAYTTSYCIGDIPTVWSGITGIRSLTNFQFPQGDGQANRDGDSIYLKKSHFTIDIEMNQLLPDRTVSEFRVVAFKSARANTPSGVTHNWGQNLFLNIDGSYFGHQTGGINGTDLMTQPINKKYWYCSMDKKFVLTPVADGPTGTTPSAYTGVNPIKKSFTIDVPWNKKVSFESANSPDDIDFRMCVVVFAKSIGRDSVADAWETNIRGLTTFLDN